METPIITVVIPVYNGEKFIKQAIESVLNQTHSNLSLKILDNCSTDNTEKIVMSLNDPRLIYTKNDKNIGMLPNWKKALTSVNTKYVAVLFADDFYKPDFIKRAIQIMENNPNIGLVSAGCEVYDETNRILAVRKRSKCGIFSAKQYYEYIYTMREVPPPSETILLNDAVQVVGGYDTDNLNWVVDTDLYLKISRAGYGACHLEDIMSCRRSWRGNSTLSISSSQKHVKDIYYLLKTYFDPKFIDENTRAFSYQRAWDVVKLNLLINLKKRNFREMITQYRLLKENDIRIKDSSYSLYHFHYIFEMAHFTISILKKQHIL